MFSKVLTSVNSILENVSVLSGSSLADRLEWVVKNKVNNPKIMPTYMTNRMENMLKTVEGDKIVCGAFMVVLGSYSESPILSKNAKREFRITKVDFYETVSGASTAIKTALECAYPTCIEPIMPYLFIYNPKNDAFERIDYMIDVYRYACENLFEPHRELKGSDVPFDLCEGLEIKHEIFKGASNQEICRSLVENSGMVVIPNYYTFTLFDYKNLADGFSEKKTLTEVVYAPDSEYAIKYAIFELYFGHSNKVQIDDGRFLIDITADSDKFNEWMRHFSANEGEMDYLFDDLPEFAEFKKFVTLTVDSIF